MAASVETAKREMSDALIEIFKLRSAPLLPKVEGCTTLQELRQVIFSILEDCRADHPEKTRLLRAAWDQLGDG